MVRSINHLVDVRLATSVTKTLKYLIHNDIDGGDNNRWDKEIRHPVIVACVFACPDLFSLFASRDYLAGCILENIVIDFCWLFMSLPPPYPSYFSEHILPHSGGLVVWLCALPIYVGVATCMTLIYSV